MLENFCRDAAVAVGLAHLAGPLLLRTTVRFASRCQLTQVSTEELPAAVATAISSRIPDLQDTGFELLGCYDCGELAAYTHSYLAYFCNRASNDFASISIGVFSGRIGGSTIHSRRRRVSCGSTPALSNEDFPDPEAPTIRSSRATPPAPS